jgi:hypothetical protein
MEGDNGRSKRKKENKSEIYCLCCWVALQGSTAGTNGKRRRRRSRSTSLLVFAGDSMWIHAPPVVVVREHDQKTGETNGITDENIPSVVITDRLNSISKSDGIYRRTNSIEDTVGIYQR